MSELTIPTLGFMNTGAICYFNSIVQSLISCRNFVSFILREKSGDSMFNMFFKSIKEDKQWDSFFTSKLLQQMGGFAPNQSSSEYFLKVCDHEKLDDLFKITSETTSVCSECKHESRVTDVSVCMMIDENIQECFETIREVDEFMCSGCKKKVKATITSRLKDLGDIIVFSFNKYFGKKMIHYPMGFFIDGDKKYRLVSTVEHMGVLQAGHYYCRTVRNGHVSIIDDSSTRDITEIEPTENTYMVFYERVKS